jgi:hypothetical protein
MAAEWLRAHIREARLFQSNVATGAAIDGADFGKPYLMNAAFKVALQSDRISAAANQLQVLMLVMTPLTEMILGWSDGQGDQQQYADHAKGANGISEECFPERRLVAG